MILGSAINPNISQGGYYGTNLKKDFTKETEAVLHLVNPYELRYIYHWYLIYFDYYNIILFKLI